MTKYTFSALFLLPLLISGCRFGGVPDYDEFTMHFSGERTELYDGQTQWDFAAFLQAEFDDHPEMECVDLLKFCVQAAYGTDTAITDAREKFSDDFDDAPLAPELPLIQVTSPDTARVNLGAWKSTGLPPEWLLRMSIVESAYTDGDEKLQEYARIAAGMLPGAGVNFTVEQFQQAVSEYLSASAKPQLEHSAAYRQNTPLYRVINTRYLHTIPVLFAASRLLYTTDHTPRVIAIDGRSASGKTTLAGQLKLILNAQVIHMDDFFLPPAMRNPLRYSEPGGNVHYERFKLEVLPHLNRLNAFTYKNFDCKTNTYGSRVIWSSDWRIVEGAYSMHPEFGTYADLTVFYDITPDEQMRRITERNGHQAAQMFKNKWIPLEETYIRHFGIREQADLILK
jgi:uridine kinase